MKRKSCIGSSLRLTDSSLQPGDAVLDAAVQDECQGKRDPMGEGSNRRGIAVTEAQVTSRTARSGRRWRG